MRTRTLSKAGPLVQQRAVLTRSQWVIYEAGWKPEAKYRVACCGRRFGKSFLAVEEIRRAARLAVQRKVSPDNEIWYAAPTFKNAKANFWRRLKRGIPKEWLAGKPNESVCSLTLKSGHVIRLAGLDNYDNLRGAGLWFVVVDECADVDFAAWEEVLEPMLSTSDGDALFIGTPKGFNWFYDFHCHGRDGGRPGFKSFTFTTAQGGNVPKEKLERARREKDARTFRQEYEATFESYEGRVLYAFERPHNVVPASYNPALPIEMGMDFNINPMSAVVIQNLNGVDHIVDEIVMPTSSTDDMVLEIRRRYGRNGTLGHISVYPDPAGHQRRTSAQGRTDISILRDAGLRVIAMSSHPLVRDRINVTNARFCSSDGKRHLLVSPKCAKSIEAFERHIYKEGTNEPDKASGHDHLCDALGYWAYGKYAYQPARTVTFTAMR